MIQQQFNTTAFSVPHRIFAIVVLYQMLPDDSVTYRSLQQAARQVPTGMLDLHILLYDNSPVSHAQQTFPTNVDYIAAAENRGLATGYNLALTQAIDQGYEWLLTLDQDTDLPENALSLYVDACAAIQSQPAVAAIVPQIVANNRVVSPNYFAGGVLARWFPEGFAGVPPRKVFAFNSGSLVRVTALQQVGGYTPWFWLDNSDSALFSTLSRFGKRVYIAASIKLQHDFSMMNMRERVSPQRYQTILLSESAFWDTEMNVFAGMERTARLALRMVKHRLRNDPQALRQLTRRALGARLFQGRTARIAAWRKDVHTRLNGVIQGWTPASRPRVSVCLPVRHGQVDQAMLRSVVAQLTGQDEILLAGDPMAANHHLATVPRIRWIAPQRNTVEQLLRSAGGDILVVCNDGVPWSENTVDTIVDTFNAETNVVQVRAVSGINKPVVYSGLPYTKASTKTLKHRLFRKTGGETVAFRATLLTDLLRG